MKVEARAGLEAPLGGVEWFSESGRVDFARKLCYSSRMRVEKCVYGRGNERGNMKGFWVPGMSRSRPGAREDSEMFPTLETYGAR